MEEFILILGWLVAGRRLMMPFTGRGSFLSPQVWVSAGFLGLVWAGASSWKSEGLFKTHSAEFLLYSVACLLAMLGGLDAGESSARRRESRSAPNAFLQNQGSPLAASVAHRLATVGVIMGVMSLSAGYLLGGYEQGGAYYGARVYLVVIAITGGLNAFFCGLASVASGYRKLMGLVALGIGLASVMGLAGNFRRAALFSVLMGVIYSRARFQGRRISRGFVLGLAILGIVVHQNIGQLRSFGLDALPSLELQKELASPEYQQAYDDFLSVRGVGDLEWGASFWNSMVWQFGISAVIGRQNKEALMLHTRSWGIKTGRVTNALVIPGCPRTGIGESFLQFGYMGFWLFWICGYLAMVLLRSSRFGPAWQYLIYVNVSASLVKVWTHELSDLLSSTSLILIIALAFRWHKIDRLGSE